MPRTAMNAGRTPSYCFGGDFGSAEAPKTIFQVNAHRRHAKEPLCEEPPMVQREDGTWAQANPARRVRSQVVGVVEPVSVPAPAAASLNPFDAESRGTVLDGASAPPAGASPPPPPPPPGEPPSGNGAHHSNGNGSNGQRSYPVTGRAVTSVGTGDGWGPPKPPASAPVKPVLFDQFVYDAFDWAVQEGFEGDFQEFVNQTLYLGCKYVYRRLPKMVPVPASEVAWLAQQWGLT